MTFECLKALGSCWGEEGEAGQAAVCVEIKTNVRYGVKIKHLQNIDKTSKNCQNRLKMLTVTIDKSKIKDINPQLARRITYRAVTRTMPTARRELANTITDEGAKRWNIRKSDLLYLSQKTHGWGTVTSKRIKNYGYVKFSTISIPLVYFTPIKLTMHGVSYSVKRMVGKGSKGITLVSHKKKLPYNLAFTILKNKVTFPNSKHIFYTEISNVSGNTKKGIFRRIKKGNKWKIYEMRVITPVSAFLQAGKTEIYSGKVKDRLEKEIEQAINYHLNIKK